MSGFNQNCEDFRALVEQCPAAVAAFARWNPGPKARGFARLRGIRRGFAGKFGCFAQ